MRPQKFCLKCGCSISHRQINARFCTDSHRVAYHQYLKRKKEREKRDMELYSVNTPHIQDLVLTFSEEERTVIKRQLAKLEQELDAQKESTLKLFQHLRQLYAGEKNGQ